MRCDDVRAGLEARLDDELTADAARAFDAHVAACAACAAAIAARREEKDRWRAALRDAATERRAPGDLRERILAGRATGVAARRGVRRLWPAGLAAAAAVAALMLLVRGGGGPEGPAPFTRAGDIVVHDAAPAADRTLVLSGKLL